MRRTFDFKPTFDFLLALKKHNNKVWFDAHRALYDAAKHDVEEFIEVVIDEFRPIEDFEDLTPKDCMFRINRDVRFSKDKSPYKINFGASLALGGRHSRRMPYYLHLQPGNESLLAGGLYMPIARTDRQGARRHRRRLRAAAQDLARQSLC